MTYQKVKVKLVEEDKLLTSKQLSRLALQLGLMLIAFSLMLGLLTMSTLGFPVTVLVLVACLFSYSWIFEMFTESEASLRKFMKLSKFWPLFYVLVLGEYLLLHALRFL